MSLQSISLAEAPENRDKNQQLMQATDQSDDSNPKADHC